MKQPETIYEVEDYASHPEIFAASEDIIRAAFLMEGKREATVKEAKKIVNRFKNKEVL